MAAQYPANLYTPRTMANRPGVSYDALKTKVIYAEDFNKDRDEIVAIETALGVNLSKIAVLAGVAGGQKLVGGSAVGDVLKLQGTSGNGTLTSPAVQALVGNNGATIAFTILNNGNVGIGTTAPGGKLEVSGSNTNIRIITDHAGALPGIVTMHSRGSVGSPTATQANDAVGSFLGQGYGNTGYQSVGRILIQAEGNITDSDSRGYLAFLTTPASSTTLTEKMRITSSGNVGIGTTTPLGKLNIQDSLSGTNTEQPWLNRMITLANSDTTDNALHSLLFVGYTTGGSGVTSGAISSIVTNHTTTVSADLYFGTTLTNTFSTKMVIKSSGNVGIGTTSPTAVLHLKAGTATANTAPLKFTAGVNNTTAVAGCMEYDNNLYFTISDAVRRSFVLAPNSTKITAGAPYTNDGYVVLNILGTDFKVMTTA